MIGLHLLVLAAVLAATAPRWLARAGWVDRAPRLGIAAWYAVLAAVMSAVVAGLVALVAPWQRAGAPVCVAWRWCVQAVQGEFGTAGRVAAATVAVAGLGVAARVVLTSVRLGRAAASRRRDHLQLLRLAGRPCADLNATVVECERPAAYVVAGRSRRVVVTTGALAALSADELAAVLAHEHAHAAGRHDLLVDCARVLSQAFPRTVLFAAAYASVRRLVEMRADDVATSRHSPISLARALVAMAEAGTRTEAATPGSVLAGALAATGGDALQRLHRLLSPPEPLARTHRAVLAMGLGLLAVAPAGLLAAAQVFPVFGMCPTLPV